MDNVFLSTPSEATQNTFRPSTRVFNQAGERGFGDQGKPSQALNLFDGSSDTPPPPGALSKKRDPNARSTESMNLPGSSSAKHHRRYYPEANNSSQISFGDDQSVLTQRHETSNPILTAQSSGVMSMNESNSETVNQGTPSAGGGSNFAKAHKHFSHSQINLGGEVETQPKYRSSSR